MQLKIIAYGIAKDILNASELHLAVDKNTSIAELKDILTKNYPKFNILQSLKFAVNADYQPDEYVISVNDEVVIIPPVSGG